MTRLLFVDHEIGGFVQNRLILARRLQKAGFDVHVALPRGPGLEAVSRHGICVHIYYLRRTSTLASDELRCCLSLVRLYRRLRPAVVHHVGLKPALYGGIAARVTA
ncbi:MAG: glycosyltransferase [Acidobacteria bacterium]|nr:glycosyltransferase [Acidobacteriota bacterium]